MTRFSLLLAIVVPLAALCAAAPAYADFRSCVAGLAAEAESHGVSAQVAENATRDLTFNPDVLTAEKSQPEFNTPVWDYIAALVDEERVTDGRAAMARYARWFNVVERRFGVSP